MKTKNMGRWVFNKPLPDWIMSAAVDSDGVAFYHSLPKNHLKPLNGEWVAIEGLNSTGREHKTLLIGKKLGIGVGNSLEYFETKGWDSSAIDRKLWKPTQSLICKECRQLIDGDDGFPDGSITCRICINRAWLYDSRG